MSNILKLIKGALKKPKRVQRFPSIGWFQTKIIKHQDDKKVKHLEIAGLKLAYRKPYELLHTYHDLFAEELYRFDAQKPIPVIVDCGANIGLSALYFKTTHPSSQLICFEPDPSNHALLQENLRNNGFSDVDVRQSAVWIHDQGISFKGAGTEASRIDTLGGDVKVATTRLHDLLMEFETVDFLKIDIEGAEAEVLGDCLPAMHRVQNLFLEYHGKADEVEKLSIIISQLNASGFQVYVRNAADLLAHPFVDKQTPYAFDVQLNLFCYRK